MTDTLDLFGAHGYLRFLLLECLLSASFKNVKNVADSNSSYSLFAAVAPLFQTYGRNQ